MQKIALNGLFINYLDNESLSENVILFIHGNSHSSRTFRHQFGDPLFKNHRLLALDLPGHGASDRSERYGLGDFVTVLTDFVKALGLRNFILVGHSLGGHIAIEALGSLDPAGILVFGTPPLSKPLDFSAFLPHPSMAYVGKKDFSDEEIDRFLSTFYHSKKPDRSDIEEFKMTDGAFREKLSESFGRLEFQDEVKLLSEFQGHKAVLHGTLDPLINPAYLRQKIDGGSLWKQTVLELEASHNMHVEDAEAFNLELVQFADLAFGVRPGQAGSLVELR